MHNTTPRVVSHKAHKSDRLSMMAVRNDLQWLPVKVRIEFETMARKSYHRTWNLIGPLFGYTQNSIYNHSGATENLFDLISSMWLFTKYKLMFSNLPPS